MAASVEAGPDAQGRYGAYLHFVRWHEGADRPSGHLETDYLAFGDTAEAAVRPLLSLTLQEVKDHLESLITGSGEQGGR